MVNVTVITFLFSNHSLSLSHTHTHSLSLSLSPGANIFLCNDSIKLGDFGLSVQLKNLNKTLPNEIKQQVGTVRKYHTHRYTE